MSKREKESRLKQHELYFLYEISRRASSQPV